MAGTLRVPSAGQSAGSKGSAGATFPRRAPRCGGFSWQSRTHAPLSLYGLSVCWTPKGASDAPMADSASVGNFDATSWQNDGPRPHSPARRLLSLGNLGRPLRIVDAGQPIPELTT